MAFGSIAFLSLLIVLTATAQAGYYYKPKAIVSGLGGICGRKRYICKRGLVCLRRRCYAIVAEGRRCNPRRFVLCKSGLQCRGGVCRRPPVGPGGSCKRTSDCKTGLTCGPVKGGTALVCIDFQNAGEKCDGKGFQCRKGLDCVGGVCKKPPVGPGGSCKRTSDCKTGLTCGPVKGGTALVCIDFQSAGEKCDGKGFQCRKGLNCVGGVCKKPPVGPGGSCKRTSDCKTGLTCGPVKGGTALVCIDFQGAGEKCDGKGFQCRKGLDCVGGVCKKPPVGPGGSCKRTSDCKTGLTCGPVKGGTALVCIDLQGEGEKCDGKGFQCREGLNCDRGVCRRRKSGKGGPCKTSADCLPILTCLNTSTGRKCFDIQGEGLSCRGAFEICARGLKCRRGVCRRRMKKKKYYYR